MYDRGKDIRESFLGFEKKAESTRKNVFGEEVLINIGKIKEEWIDRSWEEKIPSKITKRSVDGPNAFQLNSR